MLLDKITITRPMRERISSERRQCDASHLWQEQAITHVSRIAENRVAASAFGRVPRKDSLWHVCVCVHKQEEDNITASRWGGRVFFLGEGLERVYDSGFTSVIWLMLFLGVCFAYLNNYEVFLRSYWVVREEFRRYSDEDQDGPENLLIQLKKGMIVVYVCLRNRWCSLNEEQCCGLSG